MTRINTVVFDLGGVLIEWDPRHLYRQLIPADEVDAFLDEIDFLTWNHSCDAGLPWDDAVAELSARHPHRADLIAAYPAQFASSLVGPYDETVAILRQLRASSVRLVALTNWSAESFRHARERFDFLAWFEGIVVSGEERVAKPDPRIFAVLLERFGLDPAATLFIDDAERNVAAARDAGMHAVVFTGADELRRVLADAGVLPISSASDA
jgi:2-haloacid dehalogenase